MKIQSYSSVSPVKNEQDSTKEPVRVKFDQHKGQSEASSKKRSPSTDLPLHLKKIIENIERLKEQLRAAKERLDEIKAKQMAPKIKQDLIDNQQKLIADMQLQLLEMGQGLVKAVKEAGVDDPSLLLSIMV